MPTERTRRLAGPLAALLTLPAALFAAPHTAQACKCAPPPELAAAAAAASAVFEGRVLSVETPSGESGPARVELSVVRTWKGLANEERVVVTTPASSAACGYPFEAGTSHLVFAAGDSAALTVSHCSRSRTMADAADDLAKLGAGITPVTVLADAGMLDATVSGAALDAGTSPGHASAPSIAAPRTGGCASGRTGASGMLLWMGVPGLSFALRRRKRTR